MSIRNFAPGNTYHFNYLNHRGETQRRRADYIGLQFGSNEWYPEPQWFFHGYCLDRGEYRSFALSNIELLEEKTNAQQTS